MRLDIESYLLRRFDLERQNCWHLLRDAWLELTGRDLGDRTPEQITAAALVGRFRTDVPAFVRLPAPRDPCIVLMQRPRAIPHVGLFYRSKVLQMTHTGASFFPLDRATVGFPEDGVGFYVDEAGA